MSNPLVAAYRYTTQNWGHIQNSQVCGCCNCLAIFRPDDIVAWSGLEFDQADDPKAVERQTAMCPSCGSEAVLGNHAGYPIHSAFLTQMNEAWFQKTQIRPARPKT